MLGGTQKIVDGDGGGWSEAELVGQVGGVGGDLMEAGDGAQGGKCW